MRLISYVRVSTDGQLDGYGPDSQFNDISKFVARHEHEIVHEIQEAITGKVTERPGFREALDKIEKGEADGIVVARFDRLARQLTVQEALLSLVWALDGKVFTADTGEILRDDPDDPMRTAMRQMAGVMAEFDRASTVARLRKGREAKAREGLYAGGGIAYGLHLDKDTQTLVPNVAEVEIATAIRHARLTGNSYSEIARNLNEEGLRTRQGCEWTATQVRRIALAWDPKLK